MLWAVTAETAPACVPSPRTRACGVLASFRALLVLGAGPNSPWAHEARGPSPTGSRWVHSSVQPTDWERLAGAGREELEMNRALTQASEVKAF